MYIYTHIYTHTHIYMYIYTHIYMYIYTHIYTHNLIVSPSRYHKYHYQWYASKHSPFNYVQIVGQTELFNLVMTTGREGKL